MTRFAFSLLLLYFFACFIILFLFLLFFAIGKLPCRQNKILCGGENNNNSNNKKNFKYFSVPKFLLPQITHIHSHRGRTKQNDCRLEWRQTAVLYFVVVVIILLFASVFFLYSNNLDYMGAIKSCTTCKLFNFSNLARLLIEDMHRRTIIMITRM